MVASKHFAIVGGGGGADLPTLTATIGSKPARNWPTAAAKTEERLDAQISVPFQDALNENWLLAFLPQFHVCETRYL